jgi:hypothetical protein
MIQLRILVVLGLIMTLAACSDDDNDGGNGGPVGPGPVSFETDIQPILDASCVGCHGDGGSGGLDLRGSVSYANLVGTVSQNYAPALRVVAGDPEASVLHEKVADTGAFGGLMPPRGALASEDVELIRRWIAEGANP